MSCEHSHRLDAVVFARLLDESVSTDPSAGVTAFLCRWEMNDFIFLLLVENLKPAEQGRAGDVAWFSILPDSLRTHVVSRVSSIGGMTPADVPFLLTRCVTATVFIGLAAFLASRAAKTSDSRTWCRSAFLTLAWFWLLGPTQNPWYWTWALPLLPFARSRAWLLMSGLLFLYYLRFWFRYNWPESTVWFTPYVGHAFFDFVVTWIEFAPWFVWLLVCSRNQTS